jgi:hypothetical protein
MYNSDLSKDIIKGPFLAKALSQNYLHAVFISQQNQSST